MNVVWETFLKRTSRFLETLTDWNIMHHSMWIVPASFCAMRYMNDGRCLPGDEAPEGEKLQKEQRKDVKFYQTGSRSSAASLRTYMQSAVRASRNLKYGEELFVDYGNNYEFIQ